VTAEQVRALAATADWSKVDYTARQEELARAVVRWLGKLPGRRVLDLGCGSATLAVELAEMGFDVVGLDLYIERARQRAAARGAAVQLFEQDMRRMNFRGRFDVIVNWDVAGIGVGGTRGTDAGIVSRVFRALAPEGKFLIETYHLLYIQKHGGIEGMTYDATSRRCSSHLTRTLPDGQSRTWHLMYRPYGVDEWETLLTAAGFEVLGTWGCGEGFAQQEPTPDHRMLWILARKPLKVEPVADEN